MGRSTPGRPGEGDRPPVQQVRPGRRARLILAGFLLVPLVELAVLILVGQEIGAGWVLVGLVLGVVLGVMLIRRSGASAWRRTRERLAEGLTPSREAADATLILVAGLLLVVPGFLTDVVAVLVLLPFTRPLVRRPLERALSNVAVRTVVPGFPGQAFPGQAFPGQTFPGQTFPGQGRPADDGVIRGEVIDE